MSRVELELDLSAFFGEAPEGADELSGAQLDALYQQMREHMEAGAYEQAAGNAFTLLHSDPWERSYHVALGYCLQNLEEYESAGQSYAIALMLDATDAVCAFRVGECLGAMHQVEEAREAFETAIRLSWLDPAFSEVRDWAQQRLSELLAVDA